MCGNALILAQLRRAGPERVASLSSSSGRCAASFWWVGGWAAPLRPRWCDAWRVMRGGSWVVEVRMGCDSQSPMVCVALCPRRPRTRPWRRLRPRVLTQSLARSLARSLAGAQIFQPCGPGAQADAPAAHREIQHHACEPFRAPRRAQGRQCRHGLTSAWLCARAGSALAGACL